MKASDLTLYSEPPLIIKPSYEIPVVNQGVSEERLDDRLGELKNWIESELLHKLIEGKSISELQWCPHILFESG